MKSMYHDLVLLDGTRETVYGKAIAWLENSKFTVDVTHKHSSIIAAYPGWHGFGITDAQTGTQMEIRLEEANGQTAVSVCHRTRQFFILAGAMVGNILEREVADLISFLKEQSRPA